MPALKVLHAGADDYLDLPFRNEELLVKVARLVERHRIARALKESEERYRSLVELSPDAIVVHHEGKFTYVNPAAVTLGRIVAEELIGRSILDVVHPDYHDHVKEAHRLHPGRFNSRRRLQNKSVFRLDGSEIDVEVTGLPFTSEGKSAVLSLFETLPKKNRRARL